ELGDAVVLVGAVFGRLVALALLGDDVDEDRAGVGIADVLQHRQQVIEVVAVDRADIVEPELLEQRSTRPPAAREFLGQPRLVLEERRQETGDLLADIAQAAIGGAIDMSLSLRMTMRRASAPPALFMAS